MTTQTQTRFLRRSGVLTGLAALAFSAVTALPAAAGTPSRVELPSPNMPGTTGTVQPLDPTRQIALRVYLADRPGVAAAARAVADHYLTPAQFQQRFGTTADQADIVRTWLTGQGMTVTASTPHYIAVTATVAQADTAFDTQVSEYDTTSTEFGRTFTIRQAGVVGGFSAPAAVAGGVVSVTGIEQIDLSDTVPAAKGLMTPLRRSQQVRTTMTGDFRCSPYWGQYTQPIPAAFGHTSAPTQLCGYTPNQIRQAYGLAGSPYTGKGTTIAVILNGRSTTELADSNRFFAAHGEATFAPGQYTEDIGATVGSTCADDDPQGDPLEESIDVQSAHLAAPDAKIVYVGVDCALTSGDNTQSWLDGATRVVDQHLADVATGSWGIQESGLSPADLAPWDQVLQQGALEGIGFDFSSGDGGDVLGSTDDPSAYNVHNVQFPASDPWSTAVGGTSVAIGQHGSVVADYAWGDDLTPINAEGNGYDQAPPGEFQEGSGGGVSTVFAEPGYQRAVVPTGLAASDGTARAARVLPDISADAGNPWLIGATGLLDPSDGTYEELPWGGGTSAASPLIAGMEADAMQAAGHPFGFANPVLYRLGTRAIRDILPVDPADPPIALGAQEITTVDPSQLTTFGEDATLTATAGYDDATGIGAPTTSFVGVLGKH